MDMPGWKKLDELAALRTGREVLEWAREHWTHTAQGFTPYGTDSWHRASANWGFRFTDPLNCYRVCDNQAKQFLDSRNLR